MQLTLTQKSAVPHRPRPAHRAHRTRRGSALLLVLITILILAGTATALMMVVHSSAVESSSIVHFGEDLDVAQAGESQAVSTAIQTPVIQNGTEWEGYVEANLVQGDPDYVNIQKIINGNSYTVRIRSAYLAHQDNPQTAAGYLTTISPADRTDITKAAFDVYEFDTVTAPLGSEGYRRGIQTVYRIDKLNIPSALYLEHSQVPDFSGTSFVVDGADHAVEPVAPTNGTFMTMPFSGTVGVKYGGTSAGISSAFMMTDPTTGQPVQVFADSHNPYNTMINNAGSAMVVPKGSELDFWIHENAEAWQSGMGVYDHHAFGDAFYDPGSANDGKLYAMTFQQVDLAAGTDETALLNEFKADPANATVVADNPSLSIDPNKDGVIGENSNIPGMSSLNWSGMNEDFSGDGKVQFEKDLNGDGKLDSINSNSISEDTNGNGTLDSTDYNLSHTIQSWILANHPEAVANVQVQMAFEDLPGNYSGVDYDYNDLVMTISLTPDGSATKDNPPVVLPTEYPRSEGIPAIGSPMTYSDLGLTNTSMQNQGLQVRSMLPNSSGAVQDVSSSGAYSQVGDIDIRKFAADYIGGTPTNITPNANVHSMDTLNVTGTGTSPLGSYNASAAVGTGNPLQLTYVTGNGTITGQTTSAGVLVVDGNLNITGQFTFYGTVIVLGNLTMHGTGAGVHIFGNVMVGGNFSVADNSNIWYSSQAIKNVYATFKPPVNLTAVPLSWKQLTQDQMKALNLP
ncbi:MAG: hypothetical protein ACREP2_07585 [Rhodanobacteraceae bacterium]